MKFKQSSPYKINYERLDLWDSHLRKDVEVSLEDNTLNVKVHDKGVSRGRLVELWFCSLMPLFLSIGILFSSFIAREDVIAYIYLGVFCVLLGASYFLLKTPFRCLYWLAQRGKIIEGTIPNYDLHLLSCEEEKVRGVLLLVDECGTNISLLISSLETDDIVRIHTSTAKIVKGVSNEELLTSANKICRLFGLAYASC